MYIFKIKKLFKLFFYKYLINNCKIYIKIIINEFYLLMAILNLK